MGSLAGRVNADAYAEFFRTGAIPGSAAPGVGERAAFVRAAMKDDAFKKLAWPHFAAFVDASNVARANPPPVHAVNEPKARLAYLETAGRALKKLGYIPIFVSDASLFHVIDKPYDFKAKFGEYPHSIARGQTADNVVLRALRKLPEAIVVSRDRYSKPDEIRDYGDVLADATKFYRWKFNENFTDVMFTQRDTGGALPKAVERLAARFAQPARTEEAP